jgi:ketosteroid isomerase-like protein
MSPENVEVRDVAEAAFRALNAGDLDGFLALTTEDIEFTSLIAEAEGTSFRGWDGVRAWWKEVRASIQQGRWELLDIQDVDDGAVIHVRVAGLLGGVPVEVTMWQAANVRDAKVSWWALFRTEREALEAVRLRA